MDPDLPRSSPRKVRFAPKGPPRRPSRTVITINETAANDDSDDEETQRALRLKARDHLSRRGRKPDKTTPKVVAFAHGVASTKLRTFGNQKEGANNGGHASGAEESLLDSRRNVVTSISTTGTQELPQSLVDLTNDPIVKKKKDYIEPWDYENSYYPTALPWRTPYSGNPEILDNAEFGKTWEYNEDGLSSAAGLGLLDTDNTTPEMMFFQFPENLPVGFPTRDGGKGKEIAIQGASGNSTGTKGKQKGGNSSRKLCRLEEYPEGYMGKMLVYKSGNVKLKLGDMLFDVCPGTECSSTQSVMAMNTMDRHCWELGQLKKRAVVTPDIDSMLGN